MTKCTAPLVGSMLNYQKICFFFNLWSSVSLILRAKMKYEVYILPFSIYLDK